MSTARSVAVSVAVLGSTLLLAVVAFLAARAYDGVHHTPAEEAALDRQSTTARCSTFAPHGLGPADWVTADGGLRLDDAALVGISMALLAQADTASPLADDAAVAQRALTQRRGRARPRALDPSEREAFAALARWHRTTCP